MNSFEKLIFDFFSFIRKYFKSFWSSIRPYLLIWRIQNEKRNEYIHPVVYLSISSFIFTYLYVPFFIPKASEIDQIDWNHRIEYLFKDFLDYSLRDILSSILIEVPLVFIAFQLLSLMLRTPKQYRKAVVGLGCYQYCLPLLLYSFVSFVFPPYSIFGIILAFFVLSEKHDFVSILLMLIASGIVLIPLILGLVIPIGNITRKFFKADFYLWLRLLIVFLLASTSLFVHTQVEQFTQEITGFQKRNLDSVARYYDEPSILSPELETFNYVDVSFIKDSIITFDIELVIHNEMKESFAICRNHVDTLFFNLSPLDTFWTIYDDQLILKRFLNTFPSVNLSIEDWQSEKKISYAIVEPSQFFWVKLHGQLVSKDAIVYRDSLFNSVSSLRTDGLLLSYVQLPLKGSVDSRKYINVMPFTLQSTKKLKSSGCTKF